MSNRRGVRYPDNLLGQVRRSVFKNRTMRGWSQKYLANKCDCSNTSIISVERGYAPVTSGILKSLALAMDLPENYFTKMVGSPADVSHTPLVFTDMSKNNTDQAFEDRLCAVEDTLKSMLELIKELHKK